MNRCDLRIQKVNDTLYGLFFWYNSLLLVIIYLIEYIRFDVQFWWRFCPVWRFGSLMQQILSWQYGTLVFLFQLDMQRFLWSRMCFERSVLDRFLGCCSLQCCWIELFQQLMMKKSWLYLLLPHTKKVWETIIDHRSGETVSAAGDTFSLIFPYTKKPYIISSTDAGDKEAVPYLLSCSIPRSHTLFLLLMDDGI